MSTMQAETTRGMAGYVGRAQRSPEQLWQVPTFFAGVLAFLAALVFAPSRLDSAAAMLDADLAALRAALEPDQEKPAILVSRAENLLPRAAKYPRQAGEIHFLAGSAYFRQAAEAAAEMLPTVHKKAIDHFEEALALGIANRDIPVLQYRLGLTLYQQGKEQKRGIDLMANAVDKGADRPAQGYGLLVQAYLALAKPNLEAALTASQKQLELTDDRNVEDMSRARLVHGELLVGKQQRAEAFRELERIGPMTSRPLRLAARLLQTKICEDEGWWNRAIPVWKELLKDADAVPGGKARIQYSLGLAHWNAEPSRPEQALEHWNEALALGGSDGDAAGLRLGEMHLLGPNSDVKEGLAVWSRVLAKLQGPGDYKVQALDLSRAREMFENAWRLFFESQEYEHARAVAELYKKLALPGLAEERVAQAMEGMAQDLKAKSKPEKKGNASMADVRSQFHRAGVAYEEAARAQAKEGRVDAYWQSAQCYLEAKDHLRAASVLGKFVELERNESRLAEAWLSLAETYVAHGSKDKARQAYYKCIEYPKTPFAFRARYQLALDEIEKKNLEQAREILHQNLSSTGPLQDRSAHEKSIFKMAELVYALHDYDKAALYFKEASRQYPGNAGVLAAQDQLADCYQKLADKAKEKMLAARDAETKAYHQRTRHDYLEQGVAVYHALADELEHRSRQQPLGAAELRLLREALFGSADMRFEMNEFAEALRRYQVLQEKYRKQVEGLIACQRIFRCYGSMVSPDQKKLAHAAAVAAAKMAQADLETMPAESESFSGGNGVWTRDNWQRWLRWVEEQLHPPTIPPRIDPVVN